MTGSTNSSRSRKSEGSCVTVFLRPPPTPSRNACGSGNRRKCLRVPVPHFQPPPPNRRERSSKTPPTALKRSAIPERSKSSLLEYAETL